jgi:DNA-binding transcriptional LysR family regulator
MDRLRIMEAFVVTVEEGSMTRAAAKLEVSLPVIVRSLAALEKRLGVRLLNRTTRRSHLTEPGQVYFERCKQILAEVAETEQTVSAERSRPVGTIRVSAPVLFGGLHIAPTLVGFLKRYAEVNVDLTLTDRIVDLVEEGIDVAVRIGTLPDSALIAAPLGFTQRVICASPGYLKQATRPKLPNDLRAHNFLRFTPLVGAREIVLHNATRALRVPIRGNFASNNGAAIIQAAIQGAGLACVLYYQILQPVKAGELKLVLQDYAPPRIPIHAVYLQPRTADAKTRAFVDHLIATFANTSFAP